MKFSQVLRHFGSVVNIAHALQVSVPTIYEWKKTGLPYCRQCQIEVETKGKLKANKESK